MLGTHARQSRGGPCARARRDLRPRKCPALIGGLLSLQQEILPTSSRDCAPRLAQTPSKCRLHRWIIWPGPVVLESRVGRVAGAARPLRIRVRARRATAESPSRGRSSEFEDRHDGAGSRGFRSQLNTQGAQWRPSIDISSSKRVVVKFSYHVSRGSISAFSMSLTRTKSAFPRFSHAQKMQISCVSHPQKVSFCVSFLTPKWPKLRRKNGYKEGGQIAVACPFQFVNIQDFL